MLLSINTIFETSFLPFNNIFYKEASFLMTVLQVTSLFFPLPELQFLFCSPSTRWNASKRQQKQEIYQSTEVMALSIKYYRLLKLTIHTLY